MGKRHYYVPQFNLKGFSPGGKTIRVFFGNRGSIVPNAKIKGQAQKPRYYRSEALEETLSLLEGLQSSVIKKLLSCGESGDRRLFNKILIGGF